MNDPIKAKIIELCPDVMELKFGCEVWFQRTPHDHLLAKIVSSNRDEKYTLLLAESLTPQKYPHSIFRNPRLPYHP
jgi:hypothetical protein